MILYFTDRQGNVKYTTSTDNAVLNDIESDSITSNLSTGIKTLSLELYLSDRLVQIVVPGNMILCSSDIGNDLFVILQVDKKDGKLSVYAEDAGLDLRNKVVNSWVPTTNPSLKSAFQATLGNELSGWTLECPFENDTMSKSNFKYDSESNATERLLSILDVFKAEMSFDYEIDGLNVVNRTLKVNKIIEDGVPVYDFYIDKDISNITEIASIENLATSYLMYGVNSSNVKKALSDISNVYNNRIINPEDDDFAYSRKYTYKVVGSKVYCLDAALKWANYFDEDGDISKIAITNYKTAKELINYAISQLEAYSDVAFSYSVEFTNIPSYIKVGDFVRLIDKNNDLYLSARILSFTKSEISRTFSAELGNYKRLESSKASYSGEGMNSYSVSVTSSSGLIGKDSLETTLSVSIAGPNGVITNQASMPTGLRLAWYEDGSSVEMDQSLPGFEGSHGFSYKPGVLYSEKSYRIDVINDV